MHVRSTQMLNFKKEFASILDGTLICTNQLDSTWQRLVKLPRFPELVSDSRVKRY